jgi:rhodanese-related sulfurtransferase
LKHYDGADILLMHHYGAIESLAKPFILALVIKSGKKMGRLTEILKLAQQKAKTANLPYEGILLPDEAAQLLEMAPGAILVDVRSRAELDLVGMIPNAVHAEFRHFPGWTFNPHFLTQLGQLTDPEALTMFICRNGVRSHMAAVAAAEAGWRSCYNVAEGFEGDFNKDTHHLNEVNGWRMRGLPWVQMP